MLNRVRAVGYVFCKHGRAWWANLLFNGTLSPEYATPAMVVGRRVRVGVVHAVGLDVQRRRRLDGLGDRVPGKSVTANWSTWSELFSSAMCAVALSPVAVTGLGSRAAFVFMFDEQFPLLPTPDVGVAGEGGLGARSRVDAHESNRHADRHARAHCQRARPW